MKNKQLKESLKSLLTSTLAAANEAAIRRGKKAIAKLNQDSLIIFGGTRNPSLNGVHKRTEFQDCAELFIGKSFKVKVWRHDGADSWPEIVDVTVGMPSADHRWANIQITTPKKQFDVIRYGSFFGQL